MANDSRPRLYVQEDNGIDMEPAKREIRRYSRFRQRVHIFNTFKYTLALFHANHPTRPSYKWPRLTRRKIKIRVELRELIEEYNTRVSRPNRYLL